MDRNTSRMEKERVKALGELLIAECKGAAVNFDSVRNLISAGADVTYKDARALYFAAKSLNFELIEFLAANGALLSPPAKDYIAAMCDYKGFTERHEAAYFKLLDMLCAVGGLTINLFSAYINNAAVNGRMDKLERLSERYGFSETELAGAVHIRIIFEIIQRGYDNALAFINARRVWADQAALDLAVSSNEWMALEYFVLNTPYRTPSDASVGQAIFEGSFETLVILDKTGYDFKNKPFFLEKACRCVPSRGLKSLEFLLERGYTLNDRYRGRTVLENALNDGNTVLAEYVKTILMQG